MRLNAASVALESCFDVFREYDVSLRFLSVTRSSSNRFLNLIVSSLEVGLAAQVASRVRADVEVLLPIVDGRHVDATALQWVETECSDPLGGSTRSRGAA